MKALLINTEKKSIEKITINDWREIAPAIGNGCSIFACPVTLPNGDTFYIDDEGLYNDAKCGLIMKDWAYPIVGNVVVLSTDEDGDSADAVSNINELYGQVCFLNEFQIANYKSKFGFAY